MKKLSKSKNQPTVDFLNAGKEIVFSTEKIVNELSYMDKKDSQTFTDLVEEHSKTPEFLKSDCDKMAQNIKRLYESCKYVAGLFLALFDFQKIQLQKPIDEHYFSPRNTVYGGMYNYSNKQRDKNSKFYRYQLPNLKSYLHRSQKQYKGIQGIFDWIFDKKFLRNKESHNLNDISQDRLEEGYYAFYQESKPIYLPIRDLYLIQNDFYQVFLLIKWLLLIFCYPYFTIRAFPPSIQKLIIKYYQNKEK